MHAYHPGRKKKPFSCIAFGAEKQEKEKAEINRKRRIVRVSPGLAEKGIVLDVIVAEIAGV
jgi:hypothetical protein